VTLEKIDYILLDTGQDTGIFKNDSLFTTAIPRINHEHPRRRFELSESFLVITAFECHLNANPCV